MSLKYRVLIPLAAVLFATGCVRAHDDPNQLVCSDTGDPCLTDSDCPDGRCVSAEEAAMFLVLKPLVLNSLAFQAFPNDEVPIKVLLLRSAGSEIATEAGLVPVAGEVINWNITGPYGDGSLSSEASLTNDSGIATISVNLGTSEGAIFQVNASAVGTDTVTFSFQVMLDQRELRLLSPSNLDTVVNRTERLRVQLTRRGLGVPISGELLQVELLEGIRDGAMLLPDEAALVWVETDLSGIATVRLRTGDVTADHTILFCGGISCEGVSPQTINVNVDLRGGGTGACQYFTDCDPGYLCVEGSCELAATYCDSSTDCPTGYHCDSNRTCVLGPPIDVCVEDGDCEVGFFCGPGDTCVECIENGDCDVGFICSSDDLCIPEDACDDCPDGWDCDPLTGVCTPPIDPGPVIDVSGQWDTRYMFDISNTLPGFFTDFLGPVVDFLDLIFRSELEINIPFIGDIIEAMIDAAIAEYVPDWVHTVVIVLGDFIHLFEHVLVDGDMMLYQPGAPADPGIAVNGEEDWLSARFFIASLCPGGILDFNADPIPTCGEVDVVLNPVVVVDYSDNDPDVGVRVDPFAGQVEGQWLALYNRNVDIAMRQLVNVLLDVVVTAASNGQWYDFEDFLIDIMPCEDLQYAIDDLLCDITDGDICSLPGVEAICDAAAAEAVASLEDALGAIAVKLEFDFDQHALIHDNGNVTQPVATQLGSFISPEAESDIVGDTGFLWMDGDFDDNSWWFGVD